MFNNRNFLIFTGVFLLNNLYLLTGKIPLILLFGTSLIKLLPQVSKIFKNSLTRFYLIIFFLSGFILSFRLTESFYYDYLIFEDLFRIVIYLVFFNLIILYKRPERTNLLHSIITYSLHVGIIIGVIQFFIPTEFNMWVMKIGGEHLKVMPENKFRVGGAWLDPNSYAATIVIMLAYYIQKKLRSSFGAIDWYLLILVGFLVNVSGSRLGLLMLGLLLLRLLWVKFSSKTLIPLVFGLIIVIAGFNAYIQNLESNNNVTVLSRFFGNNERIKFEASHSSNLRLQTFSNGIEFATEHLGLGHGLFLFKNYYWDYNMAKMRYHNYPHNWFIYTLAEFGIWSFLLFIFVFKWFLQARRNNQLFLFFLFACMLMLLSNIAYYPTFFLCITYLIINKGSNEDRIYSPIPYREGAGQGGL